MASNSSSKIRIGIIGCDSFHTPAFINQFIKRDDCEVAWVDKTLRSSLEFSANRQQRLETLVDKSIKMEIIDLQNHEEVDLYCVLNVDASKHMGVIEQIRIFDKPIFVDKPIFHDLLSFEHINSLPILSCSGFRFCKFLNEAKQSNNIKIVGPLSFVDGIDGYFWYGIHHIEMLHTITNSPIQIDSLEITETGHILKGNSGNKTFEIFGQTVDDIMFSVEYDGKKSTLDSYDTLYESLTDAIIDFSKNPYYSLDKTKEVIKTLININEIIDTNS